MTIKILGSGSATPFLGRYSSSILLNANARLFLFDCGEGMQMQLLACNVKIAKINHIFISHLHGDHYLGLIGLLSSMNSWGRKNELHVYAPAGLKEILSIQFRYQQTSLGYTIHLHEVETTKHYTLYEDEHLTICTIPLQHRIPCAGFLVREKPKLRNLIKEKFPEGILLQHIQQLKLGNDVYDEAGNLHYSANEYTHMAEMPRTFAYCTDTKYDETIIPTIKNVDLLYHEATFTEEHAKRAGETCHSTASQAANIARLATVQKLVIGHFSSRYKDTATFLTEAKAVFPNTLLASEGLEIEI